MPHMHFGIVLHWWFSGKRLVSEVLTSYIYIQGDSDVILVPAGFRRHLLGKTLINVFQCDIAEIRFVSKIVIIQTFS